MAEGITTGNILIKEGTPLPESLHLEGEPFRQGWRLVKNLDSSGMDRKLCAAGWTFFKAGDAKATAVGSDLEETTRSAVKRVIGTMKSHRLNCVEIAHVAVKHFLGLPCVTVSAHARHIQESTVLFHARRLAEWDRARLAAT